jgi:hypothetical protein
MRDRSHPQKCHPERSVSARSRRTCVTLTPPQPLNLSATNASTCHSERTLTLPLPTPPHRSPPSATGGSNCHSERSEESPHLPSLFVVIPEGNLLLPLPFLIKDGSTLHTSPPRAPAARHQTSALTARAGNGALHAPTLPVAESHPTRRGVILSEARQRAVEGPACRRPRPTRSHLSVTSV